ncbi:MAG: hypothetical protein MHMPM18_003639 [Marteilia pararefringens]
MVSDSLSQSYYEKFSYNSQHQAQNNDRTHCSSIANNAAALQRLHNSQNFMTPDSNSSVTVGSLVSKSTLQDDMCTRYSRSVNVIDEVEGVRNLHSTSSTSTCGSNEQNGICWSNEKLQIGCQNTTDQRTDKIYNTRNYTAEQSGFREDLHCYSKFKESNAYGGKEQNNIHRNIESEFRFGQTMEHRKYAQNMGVVLDDCDDRRGSERLSFDSVSYNSSIRQTYDDKDDIQNTSGRHIPRYLRSGGCSESLFGMRSVDFIANTTSSSTIGSDQITMDHSCASLLHKQNKSSITPLTEENFFDEFYRGIYAFESRFEEQR